LVKDSRASQLSAGAIEVAAKEKLSGDEIAKLTISCSFGNDRQTERIIAFS
jgi:hypothetical protein